MLLLKLALSPTLILVASLAARRWGVLVAGWIAGFPLTSGPVSIFLAVEQSPSFARLAAEATLVGVVAMTGFCFAYARLAPRHGVVASLLGAIATLNFIGTRIKSIFSNVNTQLANVPTS